MNDTLFFKPSLRLVSLLLCICIAVASFTTQADNRDTTVSPWLYKQLRKVEKLLTNQAFAEAGRKLEKMLADVEKGGYEEAVVLRSLASAYALQEQYNKAADALSRCLALNALPVDQEQTAMLNLGQLYLGLDQYRQAANVLEPWLAKNPSNDANIYILLANALARLKQYRKALPNARKAIKLANQPEESWYQLNLALYYELGEFQGAAKVLLKLIHFYPDKKVYWNQLVSVYQQQKQLTKAASIKHLAYQKGLLKSEKEMLELVKLFLYINAPYQAAMILQQEIKQGRVTGNAKNWQLQANAWTQAREFEQAVRALEKASGMKNNGRLFQQLGRIHVEQEKWPQAIAALNKSLQKGGLKNPGDSYILLGICYYELQQSQRARNAFVKAQQYKKNLKSARQWLKYIDNETSIAHS